MTISKNNCFVRRNTVAFETFQDWYTYRGTPPLCTWSWKMRWDGLLQIRAFFAFFMPIIIFSWQFCMFIIEVLGQRWVASVCFVASKIKEAVKSWPLGKSWCSICIPFMTIQGGDKLPMKAVLNECAEHRTAESVLTLWSPECVLACQRG